MNWLQRKVKSVPDDTAERQIARATSDAALEEAHQLADRAEAVAATIDRHNRINHYSERLQRSYVLGVHHG